MKISDNMDDFRQKILAAFQEGVAANGIYFCSVASLTIRAAV
jgi:hypothetical protein